MRPALRRNLFRRLERHRMRFLFSFACLGGGRCVARFTMENASNRPMHHGPFYKTAPRHTFIKCTGLFTLQCTEPFTVVSTVKCTMSFTGRCTEPFTTVGRIHCTWSFTPIYKNQCTRSFTTFSGLRRQVTIGRKEGKRAFCMAGNPPGTAFYAIKSCPMAACISPAFLS